MPNNNVAILSIMSKFDEKSAREAAKRADKVYEEALSDIGNVNFDKKLIENFDKAMNLLKNKFKKVNLSSYTNSLLDSIFSDKDIKEKSKDIELFISKIEMLKKASSGQDINAFNTFSAKQIDALISRTEKLAQKQEEINEKTREYNREATKIAKANRSISTIDKNYGNQDYSKTLESLKKSLGTEKEFTAEQNQSIENLAKMVNLYQVMEKSEPQKGTAEAIRYSKDLLAVTQKIKEERDKIDAFSKKGASTYITNNGLSSIDKVSDYTVSKSKEDFVKASLSNLKSQEAKLQSELTTYISDSVQKNLAKVSKEVDAVVDKAEKRVENLQNKIDSLQSKSTKTGSDNSIIGGIVSDSDIKSLEEIEDRLYAISDLDAEGEATKQQLKEYIQLYKQYEQLIASDSTVKFDPGLKEEYDFILESDSKLKKYADTLDETISKQKELNTVKSDEYSTSSNTQTEQLAKQEEQIKETIQAEKQLQDTQEKVSSNTKISVDAEQAIADINKIKESLNSIPEEKNIKITISDSDYTNTPLLSDAEGNTITAFRGVVGAWSGLINQDGIGFFTDKLKLAADYADSLAESGKVYQANLSFKNPLEVEGNGSKWDEIDFNGVKKTTDEIVELAKQLGHDGVIFKNIRDGFTDTDEDISNVMVALNAAQIKNEQVIGMVKAGTGEMVDVASKIDNATDTATNSTVEFQNKIQEKLKETQKVAEQVSEAMNNVGSDKSNISSGTQIKDVFQGDNNSNTSFSSNLDEIEKEKSALLELRNTVSLIIEEIDRKTQAFHNEKSAVDLIIPEEIATLESLERELKIIIESIEQISKIPINIDFNLENLDENSANVISKLKDSLSGFNGSSLTNISSILEGFKISKANVENLQKLANAILTLKSNLNNVGNSGQQFLSDIKELVAQSDGLKDLATVLKSSQKQIDNAKKTTNANVDSKNTEKNANAWKELIYSIQRYSEVSKRISSGKALEGDIEEASRLENKISQLQKLDILSPTQIEKSEQMLIKLYDSLDDIEKKSKEATLESLNSSIDKYRNDYNSRSSKPVANNQSDQYKKLLANYETSIAKLEAYRDKIRNNPLVSKEDLNQIDELTKKVKKSATAFNSLTSSQKGSTPLSRGKTIEWANDLLEQNSKWSKKAKIEVQGWINKLATADPSNVEEIRNRILEVVRAEREAGNAGKTWLDMFSTKKLHSFLGQAASMFSFYDLVNVGREGFQTIRELDTALTEMKKVSDETTQSLKNYQATTFDVGDAVGATAKTIQESTADWMRLGESINEAAESAKASNILLNVSEFESIDEATESLVAMSQAYSELGKMDIIDVLNNIGNNYSIATDGLATALQKSASALKTANNDLNSAVALATAGNAVVQDPDSVGAGIRTISLRLVGTEAAKQELESIGEETDDVITTTSKLRDTILSATAAATNDGKGFDIFDSNGNYKSTYEIMQGLADLYDDIVAKDKELGTNNLNLLLETIAGKNRSNIAASILQNGEMLRSVYQDAQNSSGSAQKELDSYLDSIDGRMTQLENRAQEFWYKVIDSDTIKNGITLLTDLLELGTNIVDTFGVLPTIMAGVGAGLAVKNIGRPKMFGLYKYADINMCSLGY